MTDHQKDINNYMAGRRGGGGADWASQIGRQHREAMESTQFDTSGEESPLGFILLIIGFITGFPIFVMHEGGYLQWEIWQLVALWIGVAAVLYTVLRMLPDIVRGILMGVVIGGALCVLLLPHVGVAWSVGSAIVVGVVMFLLFGAMTS